MSDADRVLEILQRWEERRREGKEAAPEELCRDCPELLDAVKQEIRELERLGPLFEPTQAQAAMPLDKAAKQEEPATVDGAAPTKTGGAALPGWCIGKYRVVERLGSGGQAEVFRAVHPNLPGRDVVIKWANKHLSPALQQQLLEEGRALVHLEDTGVARVYDVDEHEGRPFVVMEFVRGRTLQQQLKESRVAPRQAAALVAQLTHTLERVHQQGICHRDLKPANILIDDAGRPRVLDFGLALMEQPWEEPPRREGEISGTFQYMAPEQANGDMGRIGPRTDVFGLGGILYALLTGRPPYQDADQLGVWEQARQGQVIAPRQVQPAVPRGLEKICLKALARAPEERYASAGEMEAALRRYLRRRVIAASLPGVIALAGVAVLGLHFVHSGSINLGHGGGGAGPLTGELVVRVWSRPGDHGKQGLRLDEEHSGAVPVRNGEQLRLEVRLNQPAYIYLLWLDGQGEVATMYPWPRVDDLRVPPPSQEPRAVLNSPEAAEKGWPMAGREGLETILLLARPTPLPAKVKLAQVIGRLPSTPLRDPQEVAVRGFDAGQPLDKVFVALHRGPAKEVTTIDDPLLQLMDRLRPHFVVVRAVRFAHQEK